MSKALEANDQSWEKRLPSILSSYETKVDAKIQASEKRTLEKFGVLEKHFEDLRASVSSSSCQVSSSSAVRGERSQQAPAGPSSTKSNTQFVPSKVYVQGFYDWKTRIGALSEPEAVEIAAKLLAAVPADLGKKFELAKEHEQFYRLEFSTSAGKDQCWKFREQLVPAISKDVM